MIIYNTLCFCSNHTTKTKKNSSYKIIGIHQLQDEYVLWFMHSSYDTLISLTLSLFLSFFLTSFLYHSYSLHDMTIIGIYLLFFCLVTLIFNISTTKNSTDLNLIIFKIYLFLLILNIILNKIFGHLIYQKSLSTAFFFNY